MCREIIHDLYDSLVDCYVQLPSHPFDLRKEVLRDVETVVRRLHAEGLGFATKGLPTLGKFLDAYLGCKGPERPDGFHPYDGDFPRFLRSFWWLVSQRDHYVDGPSLARAIRRARTLFFAFYKLEIDFTPEQQSEQLRKFVETEAEVAAFEMPGDNRVAEFARHAIAAALTGFRTQGALRPKHGPGAVASGEKDEEKWVFSTLYESLHRRYPYYDYMYGIRSNGRALQLASRAEHYRSMKREPSPTAKIIFVPKDSRGPRIISSEPLELQFMQQAVARPLVSHLERNWVTRGHVNFTDQSINGALALAASRCGAWATLDLSEASDRVSLLLVESLWPAEMIEDLKALRSHHTLLPGGEKLRLTKFAPMGSALCFPVESLVFWAICVGALQVTGCSFEEARNAVFVYGDDIIVPSDTYAAVSGALSDHGLVVNDGKSFWEGWFRESCGVDAWQGHVVTPVRIRKLPSHGPSDVTAHMAWLDCASRFIAAGMVRSGECARQMVERVIGVVPTTSVPTSYLSVVDPTHAPKLSEYRDVKWSPERGYPTAKLLGPEVAKRELALDSWERLHRSLLSDDAERDPSEVVARTATKMSQRRHSLTEFGFWDWVLASN